MPSSCLRFGAAKVVDGSVWAARLKGAAQVGLVLVAVVALIATSPPREDISVSGVGPRVELSPDRTEVVVRAAVRPNAEAVGASRISLSVRVNPLWTGPVPEDVALEVEALDSSGQVLGSLAYDSVRCEGETCLGLDAIRFRLLDPADSAVVINWNLEAVLYFGPGDVPVGAGVELELGAEDPGVTGVIASGTNLPRLQIGARSYGIGAARIQIYAPNGISPDSEIRFEPLSVGNAAVLHEEDRSHVLENQVSVRVTPPERCRDSSCDWSLLVAGSLGEWQLVASGDIEVQTGVATVTPVVLASETVVGEQIDIGMDERVHLVAVVEVDRELVAGRDFDVLGPLAVVEFDLLLEGDPEAQLNIGPSGFSATVTAGSPGVVGRQVALDCDEVKCRATTEWVMFIPKSRTGTVTWAARAYVPFFVTRRVPPGATVGFEVLP